MKRPRTAGEGRRALLESELLWSRGAREEAVRLAAACGAWLEARHWKLWAGRMDRTRSALLADLIARDLIGVMVERDFAWLRVLRHWALSRKPARRRASALAVLARVRRLQDAEAGDSLLAALRGERSPLVLAALAEIEASRRKVNR